MYKNTLLVDNQFVFNSKKKKFLIVRKFSKNIEKKGNSFLLKMQVTRTVCD